MTEASHRRFSPRLAKPPLSPPASSSAISASASLRRSARLTVSGDKKGLHLKSKGNSLLQSLHKSASRPSLSSDEIHSGSDQISKRKSPRLLEKCSGKRVNSITSKSASKPSSAGVYSGLDQVSRRKSPTLLDNCSGKTVNFTTSKSASKPSLPSDEVYSGLDQISRRKSPRLLDNCSGKRVNSSTSKSAAKRSLSDEVYTGLDQISRRKSPRLIDNCSGTRVNSTTSKSPSKTSLSSDEVYSGLDQISRRKSPRLLDNCNGKGVNSTKSPSKPSLSSDGVYSGLDQISRRKSPRLLDNCSGKRVNSTSSKSPSKPSLSSDGVYSGLDQISRRKSPRLLDNCSGKRANCTTAYGCGPKRYSKKSKHSFFIGESVPIEEARSRWPWRYVEIKDQRNANSICPDEAGDEDDELILDVKCHYYQAEILKCIFNIGDCAYVKGKEGSPNYVGKILEFFETMDGEDYFRVQWFFRAEDTVIQEEATSHDNKHLFYSSLVNDNLLHCIVSKVEVAQIAPSVNFKFKSIPPCDFYYDMEYSVDYSTISTILTDNDADSNAFFSSSLSIPNHKSSTAYNLGDISEDMPCKPELALLDMYSGCGAMSTGLSLGAKVAGVNLVTKWAVDINNSACESLRLNHPQTQVRNESAEDFLDLLKGWDDLCKRFAGDISVEQQIQVTRAANKYTNTKINNKKREYEYIVEKIVDICYGDPTETGKRGLNFQVRWFGYGPSEDTWEPIEGLRNCQERIRAFVLRGMKEKLLPRPGEVDALCGGPPCQGITGSNRFRNSKSPLADERNHQVIVFMDIIDFLRPKFILMENVIDILRFANGCLAKYAISRLVQMNYQSRLGIMAAGGYGLPQFRLRVFLWGAHPFEKLPQFPLPTHDVVFRYGFPIEFERNVVAYDEGQSQDLGKAMVLADAISDLPPVTNDEDRGKVLYTRDPESEFQKFIRAPECDMLGFVSGATYNMKGSLLYDHQPSRLTESDYLRVCKIPKRKGANFRDLPGVSIGSDNVVRRTEEALMPNGRLWVPDYAINFRGGRSKQPFRRLWWDETVPTVFCKQDPHFRSVIHPEQDRVLTVRECARLQGFHDCYRFYGTIKERYSQVGNAVAVPVGRALGYALGMAAMRLSGEKPLMTLPPKFSHSTTIELLHHSHCQV